jgi:AcrR family transcriptional regulator
MRISELSALSGTPLTTIKHYLREGLLPAPIRTGKTMSYYTGDHLAKLTEIRELKRSGLPLATIREGIAKSAAPVEARAGSETISSSKREGIIRSAVGLFREKGYGATKISDVAERAGISTATFYQYFGNKEALFLDCADSIFYDIGSDVPEIREEKDAIRRIRLRACHFAHAYRHMIDMLNQIRGASITKSPQLRAKLDEVMENLIGPIRSDLDLALDQYRMQRFDSTLLAHLLLGAAEYLLYYQRDSGTDLDTLLNEILTTFFGDAVPGEPGEAEKGRAGR